MLGDLIELEFFVTAPCVSNISSHLICIGNYTVREVLMKNRTRVWRNVYNTASA